jgi:hypothetical protein
VAGQPDFTAADQRAMHQPSADTIAQLILGLAMLLGLLIVAVLLVQRFRGGKVDKGRTASDLLSNFEEMRSRGDIDDADYRKIKSVLGAELHSELKDGKDKL